MGDIGVIILAAGKGTRMRSSRVKVLHEICGVPMLAYPIELARDLRPERIAVVVGFQAAEVRKTFADRLAREGMDEKVVWVEQAEQLGTGHAVTCAREPFDSFPGEIVILYGDVPLLRAEMIEALLGRHRSCGAAATVLTVILDDPTGYGRIIRDPDGEIARIVEHRDAGPDELAVHEINTGIYCFDGSFLFEALDRLGDANDQGEYYLTDIVEIARDEGRTVAGLEAWDRREVEGINNRRELAEAVRTVQREILDWRMLAGATIVDPDATYIEREVRIGKDTVIEPGCTIRGATRIGEGCTIEYGSRITDSEIEDGVHIKSGSVIDRSRIAREATVGPMANIRPGCDIGPRARIGNFVELKKAIVGEETRVAHLTYLGDAELGRNVNIGCGTITCNYDGVDKHRTVIEDDVFVGSDTQLIAPVRVGRGAYVGSGTTVTLDVPPNALAVGRARQKNIADGAKIMRQKKEKK